ncbi:MFS transporter [Streptococcus pneumoniae]|uniref:hypothetical protein n=1 Tax=Streptococcus pneumoniae TaxID=1313 RepID=UPI000768C2B4|nr:hypothetical protein [Streptococcus pneumoniae]CZD89512.1 MFS transporter [Streptococcus pneumoniae]CZD93627.1 MFS transporter [Streptococcus pneumoniae]CZD98550.1 MFS transporter [Streptococcus pneumoniae]CZE08311.1 MFS transporter [Streptococcus pneumoniae]VIQ61546.1 MFS transporter [Streptococcus pneumoniae]
MSYFAGAMISPLYVRIIGDDMTDAMGVRQATAGVVNILSNLIGGVLIGGHQSLDVCRFECFDLSFCTVGCGVYSYFFERY